MAAVSFAPSENPRKWQNRAGARIGYLVTIEPTHRVLSSGRRMPAWRLRCDCGAEVVAMNTNLAKGKHQSCGCKKGELTLATRGFRGDTKLPEYRIYRQMLDRCYLPSAQNYPWYGGKGVTVCERWRRGTNQLTGFQCFMEDMGARPDGLTLDRRSPFQPYEPSNCRWATWGDQARNKREHYLPDDARQKLIEARAAKRRKISPKLLREIRERLSRGEKQTAIAAIAGIAQTTVSDIKLGKGRFCR